MWRGGYLSLPFPWEVVVRWESGRYEFLRGPFALFEAHSRAKFVRNLIEGGDLCAERAEVIVESGNLCAQRPDYR